MAHIKTTPQNMTLRGKMHTLYASLFFVLTEAQKLPGQYDFMGPRRMDENLFPVPFGHIYREGFGYPESELKQPVDMLELRLRTPKNEEEAKILLRNAKYNKIIRYKKPHSIYSSDTFLRNVYDGRTNGGNKSNDDWPRLPDLAAIQIKNSMSPLQRDSRKHSKNNVDETRNVAPLEETPKKDFFAKGAFDLTQDYREEKLNWTTCEDLESKVFFNPKDIVDIEWEPFYVWSIKPIRQAIVHRFSYPTKKLVKKYYDDYHLRLNKSVDWQQPKLLMSGIDEMLLVAVNKRGLFVGINKQILPDSIRDLPVRIPTLDVRLKIDDPYLFMMICDHYYATVMAVSGDVPGRYKDKIAEAATVGFKGMGKPVWRDHKAEKEVEESVRRQELMDEEHKIIKISEEVPPMY